MAGYILHGLVFLGLICFTYQQKNLVGGELSDGVPPEDLKPGYEFNFADEQVEYENTETLASVEIPRGLVGGVLSKVTNVTGIVTDGMPGIGDLVKGTLNISEILTRILSITDFLKNGLDIMAMWRKVTGMLTRLPVFGKIFMIIDSIRAVCKCIRIAIMKLFNNFLGLECRLASDY